MPGLLALVTTFSAGLVSFIAPCTLPLVPAYLAYAGGMVGMDLTDAATRERARGRLLAGTLLFVLGFGIVFVLLGIAAGGIGHAVHSWGTAVQVVGGLLLTVFGLLMAGVLRLPEADSTFRFEMPQRFRSLGIPAALPFGVVFGIGWTPCVGPLLGTALSLAAYALGLGLPFVVVALAWASFPGVARGLGRFGAASSRVAGLVIAALGIALATGLYSHLTSFLAQYSL